MANRVSCAGYPHAEVLLYPIPKLVRINQLILEAEGYKLSAFANAMRVAHHGKDQDFNKFITEVLSDV